jgi:hypothetical protein
VRHRALPRARRSTVLVRQEQGSRFVSLFVRTDPTPIPICRSERG